MKTVSHTIINNNYPNSSIILKQNNFSEQDFVVVSHKTSDYYMRKQVLKSERISVLPKQKEDLN